MNKKKKVWKHVSVKLPHFTRKFLRFENIKFLIIWFFIPIFIAQRRTHKKNNLETLNSRYWVHFSYCAKEKVIRRDYKITWPHCMLQINLVTLDFYIMCMFQIKNLKNVSKVFKFSNISMFYIRVLILIEIYDGQCVLFFIIVLRTARHTYYRK